MKYCPKCGVQCEDDQLFCAKCGTALPVNINIENETPAEVKAEPEVTAAEEKVEDVAVEAEVVVESESTENSDDAKTTESTEEAPKVVETVFNAEPVPEGKLNVGMLVWSIINIACCCTPLGVISLIMTILAKNSSPEDSGKKIKTATILNIIGTVGGFIYFVIAFIIGFLGGLA